MKTYSDRGCEDLGIAFQAGAKPHINPKHIDGPLLSFRDGQVHWLTLWERILFRLGLTDAVKLEEKHRPNLVHAVRKYGN